MCGYEFRGTNDSGQVEVRIHGKSSFYRVHYNLDFTSARYA